MSECRIVGPYYPVGDVDWRCTTHGVSADLRDPARYGAGDLRREDFFCPVGERYPDPAVAAAAVEVAKWWDNPVPGDARNYIEVVVDAARPEIERQQRDRMTARAKRAEPPEGWYYFGTHTNGGLDGIRIEFSEELDEDDGMPLWERLVPVTLDEARAIVADEIEKERRALPDVIQTGYLDRTRDGDDCSWAMARARDIAVYGLTPNTYARRDRGES